MPNYLGIYFQTETLPVGTLALKFDAPMLLYYPLANYHLMEKSNGMQHI